MEFLIGLIGLVLWIWAICLLSGSSSGSLPGLSNIDGAKKANDLE